jgi:hypothetical protein
MTISGLATVCINSTGSPQVRFICYDTLTPTDPNPGARLFVTSTITAASTGRKTVAQSFTFSANKLYYIGYEFMTQPNLTHKWSHVPRTSFAPMLPDDDGINTNYGYVGGANTDPLSVLLFKSTAASTNFLYMELTGVTQI